MTQKYYASPIGGRRGGDGVVADGQVLCVSEREGKRFFFGGGSWAANKRKKKIDGGGGWIFGPTKVYKVPNIFQIDHRSLPVLVNSIHILITVKN
jgi:hypothetical protein